MKERILSYRKSIDALLEADSSETDWQRTKEEHLTQVGFFQHERLIHLIVTVTFALLELISVCAFVIAGALDSASTIMLGALSLVILVLLVPYINHYYLLENEVQKMYGQYDKIVEHISGNINLSSTNDQLPVN